MSTRSARHDSVYRAIEALLKLSEEVEQRRRQLARDAGLSDQQCRVLEEVGREAFLPSLFARGRSTSAAGVSRTLRQLLEAGLVDVGIAEQDGRQRDYALTAAGRRVLKRLQEDRERALSAVWDPLPLREVQAFAGFAEGLSERLLRYGEEQTER